MSSSSNGSSPSGSCVIDVDPVTIDKLRWLLGKAVAAFGERPVGELHSKEIASWRIALPQGHRLDEPGTAKGSCARGP